jgi:hypothetical protein
MSIINKPPEMVKREYELQEPIAVAVEKYAAFIASTPDHVVNSAFKMVLWRDADFRGWRKQQRLRLNEKKAQALRRRRERDSKNPPREELPCLHPRGDRNGALFSGAISGGQSLPPHHGHSVVIRLSLFQVLLHPLPLHDTVHRLFRPPLRGLYFRAQSHPHNSGRKITRLRTLRKEPNFRWLSTSCTIRARKCRRKHRTGRSSRNADCLLVSPSRARSGPKP